MAGRHFSHQPQVFSPEQLQAFHAANINQPVPTDAMEFMRQHGIGFVFEGFSQIVEEASLQKPTYAVASRATLSGQGFRPFTTTIPPPSSPFTFGKFSSSNVVSGSESQPQMETPACTSKGPFKENNSEQTFQVVNRPEERGREHVRPPQSAGPAEAFGKGQKGKAKKSGRDRRLYKQQARSTEDETLIILKGNLALMVALKRMEELEQSTPLQMSGGIWWRTTALQMELSALEPAAKTSGRTCRGK
jgi:hypothetical protein